MEERKGLLTPEHEEYLAGVLDYFFKFKNSVMERFDHMVLKLIIQAGDNNGLHRINPSWKETLIPIIDAAMAGDFNAVRQLTTDLLNGKIDLPFADEEIELRMFDSFTRFVAAAIEFYVVKTAAPKEEPAV